MSSRVKLSDGLILDASLAAEVGGRSIAEQIEFWARLGQAIEPLLEGDQALALRQAGTVVSLAERLATVDSPTGRRRVAEYLASQPFPHYQPEPGCGGLLIRIAGDGARTLGRFVSREFRPIE
jgi:hypothetical protein